MPVTAEHIASALAAYVRTYPGDGPGLAPDSALIHSGADITARKEIRGHVTAGAVLTNQSGQVLFIRHRALGTWLLPGGHLEPADTTLLDAALRELTEETGIPPEDIHPALNKPVHIDMHPIPASPAKGEPGHQHIDFRFLFSTTTSRTAIQHDEITDAAWREITCITSPSLRSRLSILKHPE
jgi:8-oxo-dGTP pyrophosphatase MutT (NUDIX family)